MSFLLAHTVSGAFVNVPNYWHCFLWTIFAMKEYERVVGWEGSVTVSPPHDGAAWALGNN